MLFITDVVRTEDSLTFLHEPNLMGQLSTRLLGTALLPLACIPTQFITLTG